MMLFLSDTSALARRKNAFSLKPQGFFFFFLVFYFPSLVLIEMKPILKERAQFTNGLFYHKSPVQEEEALLSFVLNTWKFCLATSLKQQHYRCSVSRPSAAPQRTSTCMTQLNRGAGRRGFCFHAGECKHFPLEPNTRLPLRE